MRTCNEGPLLTNERPTKSKDSDRKRTPRPIWGYNENGTDHFTLSTQRIDHTNVSDLPLPMSFLVHFESHFLAVSVDAPALFP